MSCWAWSSGSPSVPTWRMVGLPVSAGVRSRPSWTAWSERPVERYSVPRVDVSSNSSSSAWLAGSASSVMMLPAGMPPSSFRSRTSIPVGSRAVI
jgi:hypothetical protein